MRHDTEGFAREDKWLEDTLSFRNELAERSNMHFHTVIHPTKARKDKYYRNENDILNELNAEYKIKDLKGWELEQINKK